MKKAFTWLEQNKVAYSFHNYKTEGITKTKLTDLLKHFPVTTLINTKGTTFKKLTAAQQASISNKSKAIQLMMANPSMIKRPVLETGKGYLVGFNEVEWAAQLKS